MYKYICFQKIGMLAAMVVYKGSSEGETTIMSTILLLIDEVPWLIAPATLIAVTLLITLVSAAIRHTNLPFKSMLLAIVLALTAGATIFTGVF